MDQQSMRRMTAILVPLFLAATAAPLLFRTVESASDLTDYPDEVEYALGAHRLAAEGRYEIVIQGERLPPRYPPWFSTLFIAPAYLLLGSDPGVVIVPVTLLSFAGVLLACAIGWRVSGAWGGALAGLGVALLPIYWYWGRHVMTDVPCTTLLLGAALIYVRRGDTLDLRSCLGAGLLIGLAALLRPPSAACVLPFLWQLRGSRSGDSQSGSSAASALKDECAALPVRRRAALAAAILAPAGIAAAATMFYNARTFGSPFRSGYHYWCAVPYDYRPLTFSLRYLPDNLRVLEQGELGWLVPALALVVIVRMLLRAIGRIPLERLGAEMRLAQFLFFGTGPLVLFHLVYFFPEARLQLPAIVLLAILIGAAAGRLVRLPQASVLIALPAVALGVFYWRARLSEMPPVRRLLADEIRADTPPGSLIITTTDPVYLEYMINRGTSPETIDASRFWDDASHRRVLPLSRSIEYADKLLTPERIPHPDPPPAHWTDHRCAGLAAAGAREAVPWVALEQLDRLTDLVNAGVPVYLETATLAPVDESAVDLLRERFEFTDRSHYLTQLISKPASNGPRAPVDATPETDSPGRAPEQNR
jgi:hypothetical protein